MREAKARLQEKYQTAQQLGQEVRMTDHILGVAAFEVLKHLRSTAQQLGQEVKIHKCSQKAGSSLYECRLENVKSIEVHARHRAVTRSENPGGARSTADYTHHSALWWV